MILVCLLLLRKKICESLGYLPGSEEREKFISFIYLIKPCVLVLHYRHQLHLHATVTLVLRLPSATSIAQLLI